MRNFSLITLFVAIAILPFFSTTAFSQEDDDISIGKIRTIKSSVLNEDRRIWVSLPEDYANVTKKGSVIIKCDAISKRLFISRVDDLLDGVASKLFPEMILVSIENTDRSRDMYPVDDQRKRVSGEAANFQKFIETELIPFVDKEYRTNSYKILMGESDSAMFAIYSMLTKPQLFNAYIASSPELGYFGEYFSNLLSESTKNRNFAKIKLFVIHGDRDQKRILKSAPEFVGKIKADPPKGLSWNYSVIEGKGHVPPSSMHEGLEFVFRGYLAPEEVQSSDLQTIQKYYKKYNANLGCDLAVPAEVYTRLALSKMRNKDAAGAAEIFEMIVKNYSTKTELLTPLMSLARINRQKGNIDAAINCYRQIISIWPEAKEMLEKRISRLKTTNSQ